MYDYYFNKYIQNVFGLQENKKILFFLSVLQAYPMLQKSIGFLPSQIIGCEGSVGQIYALFTLHNSTVFRFCSQCACTTWNRIQLICFPSVMLSLKSQED